MFILSDHVQSDNNANFTAKSTLQWGISTDIQCVITPYIIPGRQMPLKDCLDSKKEKRKKRVVVVVKNNV